MRKWMLIIVLLIAAGAGIWKWRSWNDRGSDARLTLYGNVDIRQVELAFNGAERIARMHVVEGASVQAGQLLAELDSRRLDSSVAKAEANLEAQRYVVARLEAGSRPEEIRRASADVAAAEATVQDTEALYTRVQQARKDSAATEQEYTAAKTAYEAAKARLESARQTLALVTEGPRQEDIQTARAQLRAAEAELALLRRELADTKLYAPAGGIIQNRILEPGDMATPVRPVYTLAKIDPVWVRAYVSGVNLGKIWLGMKASVSTDSFPGKQYDGWVGFISPTAEFTPKTVQTPELRTSLVYQVRVFVHNPSHELRLGMPATVTIDLSQPFSTAPADLPATTQQAATDAAAAGAP